MFFNLVSTMFRVLLAVLLFPALTTAQSVTNLSLQEAIGLAKNHSSSLRADTIQFRIAGARVSQAAQGRLPEIAVNSTYQRLSNNIVPFVISVPQGAFAINPQILNQSYNALQLRQLLYQGGKLNHNINALRKDEAASLEDYRTSEIVLQDQVIDLWFNLFNARTSEEIIQANIDALSKRREDLDRYRIQGIVLANDVLKIDLALTNLRSNLADIVGLAGSLNYNLCVITGLAADVTIHIPKSYIKGAEQIDLLSDYVDAALLKRHEIVAVKLRSEAASYRVKAANSDYLPTISLIGSYNYDRPNQRIIPNLPQFNNSAFAGVTLNWRLSNFYTNHAQVSERRLAVSQLQSVLQSVRENIQTEVNTNYLNYKKALEKIKLTQTEVLQAVENERVEQNKLNTQTTTPTDYLRANADLLQAQLNLATANANAELAYYKLQLSTAHTVN